ncbi:TIGR03086 family metal-binding protein [Planobispora siamensis]|uniref:TIGR03086 family protein n=1 Tax=Planobispora siamensis TaxID=936338 RepID=A0A8J3WQ05_9ACTN|nr:TIGR03086 family metal-binding protein [Planobispora siamensis]GIH97535.1 hypothetical protein Psi01_81650 [Planobispora siamensis]
MDARALVAQYYHAWQHRSGDMSQVPLAEDFTFTGPVAGFTDAEGFRAMARQAGAAVRDFQVRHQFAEGDLVCSVIDWQMDPLPGTLTAAELLRVRDGRIVSGELIYDAEDLRRAMAAGEEADLVHLLERSYTTTTQLLACIPAEAWTAPSACAKWTVRQAANHLTGALSLITRIADGQTPDPAEVDAQHQADTDHLGADAAVAFQAVATRSIAVFGTPGTLTRQVPFLGGTAPGSRLASICLIESLVHGWDIAHGAGVEYPADAAVVRAVQGFAEQIVGDGPRHGDRFAEPVPVGPDAAPFAALLGYLGRQP